MPQNSRLLPTFYTDAARYEQTESRVNGALPEHGNIVQSFSPVLTRRQVSGRTAFENKYGHDDPQRGLASRTVALQSASITQGGIHGQARSAESLQRLSHGLSEAAENPLLLAGSGSKTKLPEARQAMRSSDPFSHPNINVVTTASRLSLSRINQCVHETEDIKEQAQSARPPNHLQSARLIRRASSLSPLSTSASKGAMSDSSQISITNNELHQRSNTAETQSGLPQIDQHTPNHTDKLNTRAPMSGENARDAVSNQSATLPSTTSTIMNSSREQVASGLSGVNSQQSSELDIESYLDGVKHTNHADHKWIRRLLKLLEDIYHLPTGGQRKQQLHNFVKCLELVQKTQVNAYKMLKRMLDANQVKSKEHHVVARWLIRLVYHAQEEAIKARDDAKIAEQVKPMAPFCRGGLHKLKCGHYRASHEECGMNCYSRSSFPDKPLTFDVRMSEIVCFKCPY